MVSGCVVFCFFFQDVKTTETKKNDLMYLKLLVGKDGKDKISVLSCIDYLTLTLTQGPGDDPIPWDAAKTLLPGGKITEESIGLFALAMLTKLTLILPLYL